MTIARFILRSLVFYWRTHLGVLLGAMLAAAVLTGSLTVGDSVRYRLRQIALERLGETNVALVANEFFFREKLAQELVPPTKAATAPALMLRGTVALPDGSARANNVQIVGVDARFWKMGGSADSLAGAATDAFVANDQLAARLGLKPGDPVVIRVEEPSLLSRDAPLSGAADSSIAIRARMKAIAGADQFGHFSLQANQVPPLTVFLPLEALQTHVKKAGRANLILAARANVDEANAALRDAWMLDDLNMEFRDLRPQQDASELRTERVFLEPDIAAAAMKASPNATGVLTYLVNDIRLGDHATPYSMVTAVDSAGVANDEISINTWLAEDLGAKPGDEVTLRYYVMADNRQLVEKTSRFKVRKVLPLDREDSSWMPPFPGISDVENCRDWEPGIPMDMARIRPKDEAYWKQYHGTPKAFISLRAGQAIWANRFGNLTSIRYPGTGKNAAFAVHEKIDPTKAGLAFQPVRSMALKASNEAQDFGELFIGFSFFLAVAALMLMAMLFVLSLEQRTAETGVLLALGFESGSVRRMLLCEGFILAALGALAGIAAGSLYTRLALHGLSTVWKSAVNLSEFRYHADISTLLIGGFSSLAAGLLAMWLAMRGQARRPASELLARGEEMQAGEVANTGRWSLGIGVLCAASAGLTLAFGGRSAGAFFGAGALLLMAGLSLTHALLVKLSRTERAANGIAAIGIRGTARRRGRSLTTVAVLASGVFMVVSVGAFREDPLAHAYERASGTGGFALFGQSTLPIYEDLNRDAGQRALGLDAQTMQGVSIVPMRVKEGDDASCLNLNRAQQPRFLGVQPELLASRKAFTFMGRAPGMPRESGWELLNQTQSDGAIPAIGDEATTRWALGIKHAGDTLTCIDERGNAFRVRLVGVLANSVLQGHLVITDEAFVKRFPSASGNRAFLVDAPSEKAGEVAKSLSGALQGRGIELVPAWQRLAEFQAVESCYLSIFEALGGLGLLLGSAGLGIVVLRNVLERRNELALMQALGFSPSALRWLVVSEHWLLILLGVGIGGLAAAVAVLPSLASPGVHASLVGPAMTLGSLALLGAGWSWLAAWLALRGPLLDALRNE